MYTHVDGDVYEGQFKGGQKEGHGKFTYKSGGDYYVGEWHAGQKVRSHRMPETAGDGRAMAPVDDRQM